MLSFCIHNNTKKWSTYPIVANSYINTDQHTQSKKTENQKLNRNNINLYRWKKKTLLANRVGKESNQNKRLTFASDADNFTAKLPYIVPESCRKIWYLSSNN